MLLVRRLRPLLAVALGLSALAPAFGARAGAPTGDDLLGCSVKHRVTRTEGWTRLSQPFVAGEGPQRITSFAASEHPRWLFATNGTTLKASTDAGCKWGPIFSTDQVVPAGAGADYQKNAISDLDAPSGDNLWVATYDHYSG